MEGYFQWAIVGGILAFIIVFLGYMGFFSVVQCVTKETEELILAYSNFNAPFLEIDHQGRLLRDELMKLCPNVVSNSTEVHIYYDDPRFTNPISRWAVAFEVTEDVLDTLALNSVSYVRIPAGVCLTVEFPYRNFISYGIGIRKAFDTLVATASKQDIKIAAPPMEFYSHHSPRIGYRLYLNNIDIVKSMCDTPFETLSH